MTDALQAALRVAGSGLSAQSARLRVVSENLANAQSTGATPGSDPYRRKTITFEDAFDQAAGLDLVAVKDVGEDPSERIQERRMVVEDGLDDRHGVLRVARQVVKAALVADDPRRVEVEDVAVQDDREIVVAGPGARGVEHLGDRALW